MLVKVGWRLGGGDDTVAERRYGVEIAPVTSVGLWIDRCVCNVGR